MRRFQGDCEAEKTGAQMGTAGDTSQPGVFPVLRDFYFFFFVVRPYSNLVLMPGKWLTQSFRISIYLQFHG